MTGAIIKSYRDINNLYKRVCGSVWKCVEKKGEEFVYIKFAWALENGFVLYTISGSPRQPILHNFYKQFFALQFFL